MEVWGILLVILFCIVGYQIQKKNEYIRQLENELKQYYEDDIDLLQK